MSSELTPHAPPRRTSWGWALGAGWVASLGLAAYQGFRLGVREQAFITPVVENATAETTAGLSLPATRAIFIESFNERMGQQPGTPRLTSWRMEGETLVLEMEPPTAKKPMVLWEALTSTDRQRLLEAVLISYLTTVQTLQPSAYQAELRGHAIALGYRGVPGLLAERTAEQALQVYASPYAPKR